jgi:hypothetical protein
MFQLVAWYSYTALIWSLKGTMLCFFARMTIGTWHKSFVQIVSLLCGITYAAVVLTVRLLFYQVWTLTNWLDLNRMPSLQSKLAVCIPINPSTCTLLTNITELCLILQVSVYDNNVGRMALTCLFSKMQFQNSKLLGYYCTQCPVS